MAWRNTWTAIREPVLQTLAPVSPSPELPWTRRTLIAFVRAAHKFLEHGDLFSAAAIKSFASFSFLCCNATAAFE